MLQNEETFYAGKSLGFIFRAYSINSVAIISALLKIDSLNPSAEVYGKLDL